MLEVVLWAFVIYGVISLGLTLLSEVFSRRKRWTLVFFARDPEKVEGELRSLLFDFSAQNIYPSRLIVIWQNKDYNLAEKIELEFPGIEVIQITGEVSINEIFKPKNINETVYHLNGV